MVTAFATGNVFVVLTVIAMRAKELLEEAAADEETPMVDVLVPTAFNLPSAGKLLALSFVLFAGWISGFSLHLGQYASFAATGLSTFFGSTFVAIPFLLDLFRIPSDTFQLFVLADQVVGGRFGSMVAAMHILSLTLLSVCALAGKLSLNKRRLLPFLGITFVLTAGSFLGIRTVFTATGNPYDTYDIFVNRDLILPQARSDFLSEVPAPLPDEPSGDALARIRSRAVLRVGFLPSALPFAFVNDSSKLVGFDVEMAHQLARDLDVRLELVRVSREDGRELLGRGYLDVVMTGAALLPRALKDLGASHPYLRETLALVVPDHRRAEFHDKETIRAMRSLRIALADLPYYAERLQRGLPGAEIVRLADVREFFRAEPGAFDGLLTTAERGASWSLIYPGFSVVVPQPGVIHMPLVYYMAQPERELKNFINAWLELKREDGTIEQLFSFWIQGPEAAGAEDPALVGGARRAGLVPVAAGTHPSPRQPAPGPAADGPGSRARGGARPAEHGPYRP